MARKRVHDSDIVLDAELINMIGSDGLHLWIRLRGLAEDWGGYEASYENIAMNMGAIKFTADKVKKIIGKLIKSQRIVEYKVGGRTFLWIVDMLFTQPLNNPAPPTLPLPNWIDCKISEKGKFKRKCAEYEVDASKVPVPYMYVTCKSKSDRKEKEVEVDGKGKEKENEVDGKGKPERKTGEPEPGPENGPGNENATEPAPVRKPEEEVPRWNPVSLEIAQALCKKYGFQLTESQINMMAPWTAEARMSGINDLIAAHNKKTKPQQRPESG